MTKLSVLASALKSLGLHKEAFLISNAAYLDKFEPAAWKICLRELVKDYNKDHNNINTGFAKTVKDAYDNLNPENSEAVNIILNTFSDDDKRKILETIVNYAPKVTPEKPAFRWLGAKAPKAKPKVYDINPDDFYERSLISIDNIDNKIEKTKLTGEIIDQWVSDDFFGVKLFPNVLLEPTINTILNESNLRSKYMLAMELLGEVRIDRERSAVAQKLLIRALKSRLDLKKMQNRPEELAPIN